MANANSLYLQIGKRIRQLRKEKELSQARLAEIVGLKRTSITNIEKGRQKILVHTLWDLADALSVNPIDILPVDVTEPMKLDTVEMSDNMSGKEKKWLQAIVKEGGTRGNKKTAN